MNRREAAVFFSKFFAELEGAGEKTETPNPEKTAPFFEFILSLKKELPLSIPVLRDFAALKKERESGGAGRPGFLERRIDRCYRRLCRVQEELGRLDFTKAPPRTSPEDFVFSRIDFSRYRRVDEKDFESRFPEGLGDFDEAFLKKNFGLARTELESLVRDSYEKRDGFYIIRRENPVLLSIMRTLDTSLENAPLFTREEIRAELETLFSFIRVEGNMRGFEVFFRLLALSLDGAVFSHGDGMTTKLFISADGELLGTFRPQNKAWTRVLLTAR